MITLLIVLSLAFLASLGGNAYLAYRLNDTELHVRQLEDLIVNHAKRLLRAAVMAPLPPERREDALFLQQKGDA